MTMAIGVRRVATYERVSSEDQRERETIKTQTEQLARAFSRESDVELVERFVDDGVSGTIPLAERPAGGRLMRAAATGRFDEVHVFKFDRLGRDEIDLLVVRRRFKDLRIRLISVVEGEPGDLGYGVQAIVAADNRRQFLAVSAAGIDRAARAGRYCGGIVAFGYRVAGKKENARLEPDTVPLWADLSAADIVRRIYHRLGVEDWSAVRVARELNELGVPTHYSRDARLIKVRDDRGERKVRTQGIWRAGRVRNLVVNPLYRGELQFGRRTEKPDREVISAAIEGLVSADLWHAAQETLRRNRFAAKNARHAYLLRGTMRCGICGLAYVGSPGRPGVGWYRCNGQIAERGPIAGRCWGRSIRTDAVEPIVWGEIERFLRDPGDVLSNLEAKSEADAQAAILVAESVTLRRRLEMLQQERQRVVRFAVQGILDEETLRSERDRVDAERTEVERRLDDLQASPTEEPPAPTLDLLAEVRRRLDEGLTFEQRQEVVRLLIGIVIQTETAPDGTKTAKALVTYRFPGVVETNTGMGSSPPRAGNVPGSGFGRGRGRW